MDPGSAKEKKHKRSKSNLQSQNGISGSTDQLISEEDDSRVLRARQQTKARFESFLQDAVAENSLQETTTKKKKKRTHTADSVLESIRAGSPIAKTPSKSEESLIQANLYKEDETPGKESKASYRSLMKENEKKMNGSEEITPKKSKSRRPKSQNGDQLPATPTEKDKSKRRKKTRTPGKLINEDSGKENMAFEDEDQKLVAENEALKLKSPKRKGERVRRKLQDGDKSPSRKRTNDGLIFSATIHRADRLKPDLQILHPMVRVHVVDSETGNYVKKSTRARNVTSFYENEHETPVDYIMPVMTQPFDFKTHKCVIPSWEEVLIFNEPYSNFLSLKDTDPKVIIFFEVVDFLSITASNRQQENQNNEKGWYHIAWAFLKVVGGNGTINTDKKVRLQLFYPYRSTFRSKNPNHLEVFHWWKQSQRIPYPSTLYITLKGVQPPKKIDPALRSMYAIQQEKGRVTFEELTSDAERRAYGVTDARDSHDQPPNWTKLPGQVNRIPNKQMLSLRSGKRGCFVVKFSHSGRYLACGCAEMDSFPVIVYEIPSGNCRGELLGHFSIIYDLCWSADDSELISTSSDGTVRTWDTKTMMTSFIKVFPHPCFVYSAQYHPSSSFIIVTGGYDRLIRVWTSACDSINGQLIREIEGHTGFINSICFAQQGGQMFSADSTGSIIIWRTSIDPAANVKRKKKSPTDYVWSWTMIKHIKEEELQGNVINSLVVHPGGLKLLVHTRNSALYMVDLRSFTIMTRYLGASNFKEHIHSTLSTCGSFVFSGSEDGVAYVWNTETGDVVSVYTSLTYENAVSDVDFHPLDHMVVFCSFGNSQPVLVYKYDTKAAKVEAKRMFTPPTTPIKVATPATMATTSQDESIRHIGDVTQDVIRMQRVRNKLDSVLETPGSSTVLDTAILKTPGHDASYPFQTPVYQSGASSTMYHTPITPQTGTVSFQMPDSTMRTFRQGMGTHDSLSTWGSDFTPYGTTPVQIPGYRSVSPHSQQHLGASGRFQTRQLFSPLAGSPVDTPGSPVFKNYSGRDQYSRQGSLSMNLAQDTPGPLRMSHLNQKPTFSFNAGKSRGDRTNQPMKRVLVMYPYEANRADEITIQPGDVITVLYQDNENWWMGELADGRQGYFPSNYVMQQDEIESDNDLQEANKSSLAKHRKETDTRMTAVTSKTGELKIISGPEDSSDTELSATQSARQRRRHRQSGTLEKTLTDKTASKKSQKKHSPK